MKYLSTLPILFLLAACGGGSGSEPEPEIGASSAESIFDVYQKDARYFYDDLQSNYQIDLIETAPGSGIYDAIYNLFWAGNNDEPEYSWDLSYPKKCMLLDDNGWSLTDSSGQYSVDEYGNLQIQSCGNKTVVFIEDTVSIAGKSISSQFPEADFQDYTDGNFPAGSEKYIANNYYANTSYSFNALCDDEGPCPDYDYITEAEIEDIKEISEVFSVNGGDELYLYRYYDVDFIKFDDDLNVYFYEDNSDSYERGDNEEGVAESLLYKHLGTGSLTKEVIGGEEIWLINFPEEIEHYKTVTTFLTIIDGKLIVGDRYNKNILGDSWDGLLNETASDFIIQQFSGN